MLELRLFQEVEEGRGRKKELEDITRKSCGLPTPGYSKRKPNNRQLPIITWLLAYTHMFFLARRLGHFGKKGYICGTQAFGWGKDENLTTIRNDYETHFADMLHGHGGHALLRNSRGTAAAGNRYDSGRRAGGQSHP